jgi:hypothetical protein
MLNFGPTRPFVVADPTGIVKLGEGMYRRLLAKFGTPSVKRRSTLCGLNTSEILVELEGIY